MDNIPTRDNTLSIMDQIRWLESSPRYWTGQTMPDTKEYVFQFGTQGKQELLSAVKQSKGLDGDAINQLTFPLPTTRHLLDAACHVLHQGRGFVVIRGSDPRDLTDQENVNLLLGVSSYFGDEIGCQDKKGNALTHITDAKHWCAPAEGRHGIHTPTGLAYHSDMGADILALHIRSQAERGGDFYLSSAWAIYKELLISYPRCLDILSQNSFPIQIAGNKHILAPLLQVHEGKIWMSVDPGRLGLHPVTAAAAQNNGTATSIPDLTPQQLEALDILSKVASKHRYCLDTQPGDIILISNWSHLHARDPYQDASEGPRRHLVRLWLRNSKLAWSVPEAMKVPWEVAYGNELIQRRYPPFPARKYKQPKYTAGSAAFVLEDTDDVNCEDARTGTAHH